MLVQVYGSLRGTIHHHCWSRFGCPLCLERVWFEVKLHDSWVAIGKTRLALSFVIDSYM
jgi:hypothetical protein